MRDRDFNLIELGGNIYFLVKLSNTDGWSTQRAVGSMPASNTAVGHIVLRPMR